MWQMCDIMLTLIPQSKNKKINENENENKKWKINKFTVFNSNRLYILEVKSWELW